MYLRRNIDIKFKEWINNPSKKPLVVAGSRQCGKTTTVLKVANEHFKHVYYIDFLERANIKYVESLKSDPSIDNLKRIIMSIYANATFDKDSVVIIDEVQEVLDFYPELKTINQSHKDINLIVLGSYLGTKIFTNNISIPVGQTNKIEMHSLGFDEFLMNVNSSLYDQLINSFHHKQIKSQLHLDLIDALNAYLITGGFPETVCAFIKNKCIEIN